MRLLFSIILLLGFISCNDDETIECQECPPNLNTDAFDLKAVEVVDHKLEVTVSYAGGCKEHEFTIDWPEVITAVYPPDFSVTLYHDSNNDLCEAYLTEVVVFDINESGLNLSDDEIRNMKITVINSSDPEEQVSNK